MRNRLAQVFGCGLGAPTALVAALVVTLSSMVGGSALLAGPAGAAEGDPLTAVSITYSVPSVSVSGLDTKPVTVTVHLIADPPIQGSQLFFEFHSAPGDPESPDSQPITNAKLVSGTASDGVWAGTVLIPSTAGGKWVLGRVAEEPFGCDESGVCGREAALRDPPTLTVLGTHQPRLLAATVPAVLRTGSSFTIKGRVVDSATGRGMAAAMLSMALGNEVFFFSVGNPLPGNCNTQVTTTSQADGNFAFARHADPKSKPTSFAVCIDGPTQADGKPITILVSTFPIHRSTSQVSRVPTGGVQTGDGSTAGLPQVGLLPIGAVLLLTAVICAMFLRRLLRPGCQRR